MTLRFPVALFALVAVGCASAPPPAPRVVYLSTDADVKAHDVWHYAPVVRAGDVVVLSGIPAARGETDEAKVRAMFERARVALAAAGATFDDVVEITSFHTSTSREAFLRDFELVAKVHAELFHPPYPAWTAIGNAVLLADGALLEMRIVAVVGSGHGARVERRLPSP